MRVLRREDGWLAAFVALLFLSFPHPLGERVIDLGAFASWFAMAALVLGLRGLTPRAAAKRGFLAGWIANSAAVCGASRSSGTSELCAEIPACKPSFMWFTIAGPHDQPCPQSSNIPERHTRHCDSLPPDSMRRYEYPVLDLP